MLDFRMKTFITVTETMNFTRAAERLGITQPAVSQHIRYIEEEYGVTLFRYEGKKLFLTAGGEFLLNAAITMKHDEIHLKEQLRSNQLRRRQLTFGATLTVGEFLITKKIAHYLKEHPEVSLSMTVSNTSELLSKLDQGTIDFAVVEGYFQKSAYDHCIYSREPYIAVCSAAHRFKKKPKCIEDLFGETLITRESGSGTREVLEKTLEIMNYAVGDFSNIVQISNMSAIKFLVEEDCGIAFLYEAAVKKELEEGRLIKIPLANLAIMHDITFIWRKNSIFAEYYRQLFSELK